MSDESPVGDWLVESGAGLGHPLLGDMVTVGRDPRATVVLQDATISRRHAFLEREGDVWQLHVQGTTGASLNGARVEAPTPVAAGDVVEIGTRRFTFVRGPLPPGVIPAPQLTGTPDDPLLLRTTASMPAIDPRVFAEALAHADAAAGVGRSVTDAGRHGASGTDGARGWASPWAWLAAVAAAIGLLALTCTGRR